MNKEWMGDNPIKRKAWFLDIDGCIFENNGEDTTEIAINLMEQKQKLIAGTREQIAKWRSEGHYIIITTGRPKSLKQLTKEQLLAAGIAYDELICGVPQERHLVNDINSRGEDTAFAHNIIRNSGIKVVE